MIICIWEISNREFRSKKERKKKEDGRGGGGKYLITRVI